MAAVDQAEVAAGSLFWVDQAGQQVQNVTEAAGQQAAAVWHGFTDWYTSSAVAERAAEAAAVSAQGQDTITQIMAQYMGEVNAIVRGLQRIEIPNVATPTIRNGVDPVVVHSRAAQAYRDDFASTQDITEALDAAFQRELQLIETDMMLAARQAQDEALHALDITHYRRVLHPELSKSGSCGLCLAASLNVYKVGDLMPIHVHCKCLTMPIIDGVDPASSLNADDRKAAYAAAGVSGASALSNVRVQVHEHGEYGPILTVKGQKFSALGDPPATGSGSGGSGDGDRPRTGSADGPDEYSDPDVPFKPSERPTMGTRQRTHILDGDPDGTGGHRFGTGRPNKTEFLESWDDDTVVANIDRTLEAPDQIKRFGDQFVFFKDFDGVIVRVSVRTDLNPPEIWTAYPLPAGSTLDPS